MWEEREGIASPRIHPLENLRDDDVLTEDPPRPPKRSVREDWTAGVPGKGVAMGKQKGPKGGRPGKGGKLRKGKGGSGRK